jgi:hypothetical protein
VREPPGASWSGVRPGSGCVRESRRRTAGKALGELLLLLERLGGGQPSDHLGALALTDLDLGKVGGGVVSGSLRRPGHESIEKGRDQQSTQKRTTHRRTRTSRTLAARSTALLI